MLFSSNEFLFLFLTYFFANVNTVFNFYLAFLRLKHYNKSNKIKGVVYNVT